MPPTNWNFWAGREERCLQVHPSEHHSAIHSTEAACEINRSASSTCPMCDFFVKEHRGVSTASGGGACAYPPIIWLLNWSTLTGACPRFRAVLAASGVRIPTSPNRWHTHIIQVCACHIFISRTKSSLESTRGGFPLWIVHGSAVPPNNTEENCIIYLSFCSCQCKMRQRNP